MIRHLKNNAVERDWVIAQRRAEADDLAASAGVSRLVAQLLLNRGVTDAPAARRFLAPQFRSLAAPDDLPNACAAAERLVAAIRDRRRIIIYGDYDVDGVTGTTILHNALRLAGADVDYYIPSRLEEGYGLNGDALERLASEGAKVVVTVDCGVTAIAEAQRARELGLELIITDHHEPRPEAPEALLVHPSAFGRVCGNPNLSGAGVALKVAWALAQTLLGERRVSPEYRDFLVDATAFAALGLIADIVPLTGENRVLASFGLRQLRATQNVGLRALIETAGLSDKARYDEYDIGFVLGPRLNALGRMGHAREAVELFTRATPERATEISRELERRNRERQLVEREIAGEAEALTIERGFHRDSSAAIVLASPRWHAGVIGIVASRLVERFHRPTVLIALENGVGQGSGRSIRHFPLHEALARCNEHLLGHGGHAMAAGVRIREENVSAFTCAFMADASKRLSSADLRPKLHLDDEVELREITLDTTATLDALAPFGMGNSRPRLATAPVELTEPPRRVGRDGAHAQFTVRQHGAYRRAIAFGVGERAEQLADARAVRLAFEPLLDEWMGQQRVKLRVLDWKMA